MKCPIDDADLQMMERQNVEIDYCPKCRGVWLDRGELDKIVERMGENTTLYDTSVSQDQQPYPPRQYGKHGERYGKRRKGLLGELFDF